MVLWACAAQLVVAMYASAQAAPETRRGTLKITGTITFVNSSRQAPGAGVYYEISDAVASPGSNVTQEHYRSVALTRNGDTATVKAEIPYSATFDANHFSDVKMFVQLYLYSGFNHTGGAVTIAVPADGTTTPVSFALRY